MIRACLTRGIAATMILTLPLAASANDLIDFLKAVQQVSDSGRRGPRPPISPRGRVHDPRGVGRHHDHGLSSRDIYKRRLSRVEAYSRHGLELPYSEQLRLHEPRPRRTHMIGTSPYSGTTRVYQGRSGRVSVGYLPGVYQVGNQVPGTPVPPTPLPGEVVIGGSPATTPILSVPPYGYPAGQQPVEIIPGTHQIGEIVDCPVPLATCIRIKDPDHIAPGAVPTVVAVRDPDLCRHKCDCCVERVVYIEVCLPPCPPRKMRISPCGTYVCMNYGDYQVELTSRNGLITIDYDD